MSAEARSPYSFTPEDPHIPLQLRLLEQLLDPLTEQRLARLDVPDGARCWVAGAGGGSVARALARRVGPGGGTVLATDLDTAHLSWLLPEGPRLAVRRHDVVEEPAPPGGFDLIHARLLLLHLPRRRQVLQAMAGALRPGGLLLVEEWDCTRPPRALAAPAPADARLFARVADGILAALKANGAGLDWAAQVPAAMRDCGLSGIRTVEHTETWRGGGAGCRLHRTNARQLAPRLRESGIPDADLDRYAALTAEPALVTRSYPFLSTSAVRAAA
ncbi:class I SAM-dependent methyltransferase [Streptomyces sp. ODS28]|uniref:class I SAM-dependent methyltransferase n=1 Tax=Streptomyces sp. ODS28 TaxID=3136688 RepID=UPI0031EBB6E0